MDMHKYIDEHRDAMVSDLKTLLRIPSVEGEPQPGAPFGSEVRRALDTALEMCRKLGLHAVNVDGYAGYAEIPGCTGEQIGVLTHLDVVPCGKGWSYPPFDAYEKNGVVWARGVCDDKGPLVASVYALAAYAQSGAQPKKNIRLIFGCNEESGWGCMDYYSAHVGLPEVGFSPDADYPIINTEKGIYQCTLSRDINCGSYEVSIHGGDRPNVVAPEAKAVIKGNTDKLAFALLEYDCHSNGISYTVQKDTVTITSKGVPAHASTPQEGKNAVWPLLELISRLPMDGELPAAAKEIYEKLCRTTDGSGIGLALCDEVSGALTDNLGIIELENGRLSLTVDIRFPVTFSDKTVREGLLSAFPGYALSEGHVQQPHHTPKEHYLVQALSRVYQRRTGQEARCIAIGGGTYARALKTGVAFGVNRPGAPEYAHNTDERMSMDELMEDVHMFADVYKELAD